MFTSLKRMTLLPASMPCADLNTTVMVGPSLQTRSTAIPTATTAATIGTIHTIEMRVRLRGAVIACGRSRRPLSSSAIAVAPFGGPSPDQTGVERHGCKHGQNHYRGEEGHARAGLRRHGRRQLHQCYDECDDEHVQHGPAPH